MNFIQLPSIWAYPHCFGAVWNSFKLSGPDRKKPFTYLKRFDHKYKIQGLIKIVLFLILTSGFLENNLFGQKIFKIAGRVIDLKGNGIAQGNIIINSNSAGTSSNHDGYFILNLNKGNYTLMISHIGFRTDTLKIYLQKDTFLNFTLTPIEKELKEVEIIDRFKEHDNVSNTRTSTVKLSRKEIVMIPSISGENDIIRVVQLLPGVSKGIEGSGDYFVRGGDADQNLLILDGATIYNTGHLFGFVSVFNPDIIEDVTIMKGAFPANYGGRLSSIIDIRSKSTLTDSLEVEGAIGLISSRIALRTPLKKKKAGIMLAGRRTYVDQAIKLSGADFEIPYYFYDLNGRIDFIDNEWTNYYISGFYAADVLSMNDQIEFNGETESISSNNIISTYALTTGMEVKIEEGRNSRLELHTTKYGYDIRNTISEEQILAVSGITDYGATLNFENTKHKNLVLNSGLSLIRHQISPIVIQTEGIISELLPSTRNDGQILIEGGMYFDISTDITKKLRMSAGVRESFGVVDKQFYPNLEPRLALRYFINEFSALKVSYSRMNQYLHRVSSSAISLPVDFWYTSTRSIKPQTSDQYTIGWARTLPSKEITIETDIYYKKMQNLTEYKDGTTLLFNADFEQSLIQGEGESYGLEILLRKNGQKLEGWLSYSLGWAYRKFDELNDGQRFNATYDRRHNGAIVVQYNFTRRFAVSTVWEYISGRRFTPVIGQYAMANPLNTGVEVFEIYSTRNAYTLADAHRLDLMIIIKGRGARRLQGEFRAGLYNVYNSTTPIQMYITSDDFGNFRYVQPGLFGTLPFISYLFKF